MFENCYFFPKNPLPHDFPKDHSGKMFYSLIKLTDVCERNKAEVMALYIFSEKYFLFLFV